jgi:hypothetical protein
VDAPERLKAQAVARRAATSKTASAKGRIYVLDSRKNYKN